MSKIIDPDQTEDGMVVAYGVCQHLDEMKHTYHGLPDFLTKVGFADADLAIVQVMCSRLRCKSSCCNTWKCDGYLWSL